MSEYIETDDASYFRVRRQAYVSAELHRRELHEIFDDSWLYAAHLSELREPGDFITRDVGGRNLIIQRRADGEPAVYLNACAHRGAKVCAERQGNSQRFTCPYHGWTYDNHGTLYATAEHGQVLRSDDQGKNWRYLDTGYEGTLWSGAVLADGRLLLGGQRGTLLQGSADGKAFRRVPTQGKGSVTSIAVAGARILAVGLDGLKVRSRDGGNSFQEAPSADGLSLTAALFNADGTPLLFSRRGVMPRQE